MGAVFAVFAAFYFWVGKMTGSRYPETLGKIHFWIFFLGVNLTFFPMRAIYELVEFCFTIVPIVDRYLSITVLIGLFIKNDLRFDWIMRAFIVSSCIRDCHESLLVDLLNKDKPVGIKNEHLSCKHSSIKKIYDHLNETNRKIENKKKQIQKKRVWYKSHARPSISWRNNLMLLNTWNKREMSSLMGKWLKLDTLNTSMVASKLSSVEGEYPGKQNTDGDIILTNLDLNDIAEYKELATLCKEDVNMHIWPGNSPYFKKVIEFVEKYNTQLFIFSGILNKECKDREDIKNHIIFERQLDLAGQFMSSILVKIVVIEILYKNSGSTIPGVDEIAFKNNWAKTDKRRVAIIRLKGEINKIINKLGLAKGKTDQAIKRKSYKRLYRREILRRSLKTPEGHKITKLLRIQYKSILNNPIKYNNDLSEKIDEHNKNLKLELLKFLKLTKLFNYQPDPIRIVEIPKNRGKGRQLGIPTIWDRSVHMLIKFVMEPIMEPLGDPSSFGFRPGRGCQMAISRVAKLLAYNKQRKFPRQRDLAFGKKLLLDGGIKKDKQERFYTDKYVIDADIKGCFDNISHKWLLENVPMPKGFEYLLRRILKGSRVEKANQIITPINRGIPQGSLVSALWMNWTLDGLEELIVNTITEYKASNGRMKATFIHLLKGECLKRRGLNVTSSFADYLKLMIRISANYVRYADDFVIVHNCLDINELLIKAISQFLQDRGLSFSKEKTKVIHWKIGASVNFLGWTIKVLYPKKVNWLIKAPLHVRRNIKDWIGTYIYPSKKSVQRLKDKIVELTSIQNKHKNIRDIILELGSVIRGWSNYYVGGKQSTLRTGLDWFILKRTRMLLYKKFGRKIYGALLQKYRKYQGEWRHLNIKTLSGYIQEVPYLLKLNKKIPWGFLEIPKDILNSSFLVNAEPYMMWKIKIGRLLKEEKVQLYYNQKGLCSICKKKLLTSKEYSSNEDQYIKDTNMFLINDVAINNLSNIKVLDYKAKITDQIYNQYIRGNNWYNGLYKDHIIPKTLGKLSSFKKILVNIKNKQLLHRNCYISKKIQFDKRLISNFRKIINIQFKSYNATVKTVTQFQLFKSNQKALQILVKSKLWIKELSDSKYYSKGKIIMTKLTKISFSEAKEDYKQEISRPISHRLENIKKIKQRRSLRSRSL